jgi:uncharacterized protein Usg
MSNKKQIDSDFEKMALGFGLTTVEFLYGMPDFRNIVQELVWQTYDLYPNFPRVREVVRVWKTLNGPLYHVRILEHQQLIRPAEIKVATYLN